MSTTNAPAPSTIEPWDLDGSIILYGVVADVLLILPLVLYCAIDDTLLYAANHQTYINMIFSSYAPIGIMWWILLADDSEAGRTAFQGAIELAGLGPLALLWVGVSSYLMTADASIQLLVANWQVWIWVIIYTVFNILLLAMHYHLAPAMYAWTRLAPLPVNPIDYVQPWAQPENYVEAEAPITSAEAQLA